MSATEDPAERRWDTGYVPLAFLVAAYLLTLLPIPPWIIAGLECFVIGLIVAICVCIADKAQGRRISHATWWAFALALLFLVWFWLRRNL